EGELAGVLWDRELHRLYLFRDRYGTKPLYWTNLDGWFLFASDLKALLAGPALRIELDRDATAAYLWGRAVPAPRTIYRGVHTLVGGTMLSLTDDGEPDIRTYWSLSDVARHGLANQFEGDDAAAIGRYDSLLRSATSQRIGQAKAGILLS